MIGNWVKISVGAVLLMSSAGPTRAQSAVDLDVESGVFLSKLPFDVAFTVAGRALPGTTQVSLRYAGKARDRDAFGSELHPAEPLVSGVDADGRFRFQMGAVNPNRHFRFQLVFERRLSERGQRLFADALDDVLRRELADVAEIDAARARAVHEGIRVAFDRALNEGRPGAPARATTESLSPSALFVASASADDVLRELQRQTGDLFAAQLERSAAAERYREAVPSLRSALEEVAHAPELRALVEALEARPELDPRNPRNALFLSPEARGLVGATPAALAARAAGGTRDGGATELGAVTRAEDATVVRERQRRNAQALRELREWVQALVLPGASLRRHADALAEAGSLQVEQVERLGVLASLGQGSIRRAERWTESLEAYASEVERALSAGERARAALATRLASQAFATEVRQTLLTETVTSSAGLYVSLDFGLLYAFEVEKGSLYLGANVYFRPVNKDAPLSQKGSLGHRLSATVGVNLTNLKLEDDARFENLVGERWNVVLGLGLRLTRSVRLGGGALLLLKNDPNPLVTSRSLGAVPYVALSLDLDIARAFRGGGL